MRIDILLLAIFLFCKADVRVFIIWTWPQFYAIVYVHRLDCAVANMFVSDSYINICVLCTVGVAASVWVSSASMHRTTSLLLVLSRVSRDPLTWQTDMYTPSAVDFRQGTFFWIQTAPKSIERVREFWRRPLGVTAAGIVGNFFFETIPCQRLASHVVRLMFKWSYLVGYPRDFGPTRPTYVCLRFFGAMYSWKACEGLGVVGIR